MEQYLSPARMADLLIPLEIGQTLELPDLTAAQNCGIRVAAIRRGFTVRLNRKRQGGFLATKLPIELSGLGQRCNNNNKVRNELMRRAIDSGMTYEDVAKEWGVSRQRAHQIIVGHDSTFSRMPADERVSTLDEFIRPYVETVISEHALCLICGAESSGTGVASYICVDCGPKFRGIRQAAGYIRGWKRTGDRHYLSMALVRIRKYKLTPTDMEWQ